MRAQSRARSCFSKVMSFYYRLHVLDSELQGPVLGFFHQLETTINSILHVFPPLTPSTALIYQTINRVPCTLPGPASESFPVCYPLKAGSLLCHLIWVWSQFVGIHCIAFWSQRDQLASFFGAIDVRFRNLKFTLKGMSQHTPNHWTVRNFTVGLCNTLWGTCIKPNASRLLATSYSSWSTYMMSFMHCECDSLRDVQRVQSSLENTMMEGENMKITLKINC